MDKEQLLINIAREYKGDCVDALFWVNRDIDKVFRNGGIPERDLKEKRAKLECRIKQVNYALEALQ